MPMVATGVTTRMPPVCATWPATGGDSSERFSGSWPRAAKGFGFVYSWRGINRTAEQEQPFDADQVVTLANEWADKLETRRGHPAASFTAKVVLAMIAIILITLTTAVLEVRLGALPSDPAISWDFGGE